ncbi:MAG: enoyl-CoA hydratase/carnithine racemase [Halioglobus sp.]|jgi:enoyl-CoA hydratase/carnithine racemase
MNAELQFEMHDNVAVITINRPDAYNTLSAGVIEGLGAAYQRCQDDDEVRVAVVTGAGEVFCAGADMSGGGSTFDSAAHSVEISSCPLSMQAWEVRKPVISACNGHAIGAGLGLAMQTDMRVLASEAKYGFLQSRRGVVTDFAMEYILPRIVGMEKAFELLVRAPTLVGSEAVEWGLAARCVPAQDVLATAMEIAQDIATNCAPLPVGLHKQLLWRSLDMDMQELVSHETKSLNHSMTLPDAVEGGVSYTERRKPRWTGSVKSDWPSWLN